MRQVKEIKGVAIRKEEINVSLFSDDIILSIKDPKDSTTKI